jgi:hypothetical protein
MNELVAVYLDRDAGHLFGMFLKQGFFELLWPKSF